MVEVLFDESPVGCGFAFAVDDGDVEMEESLIGMQLQHAIEIFYAVVVHLVIVAEQPQPLLILCQGNAAFPLPDQVGGSQIAAEARVMQIHPFCERHHNVGQGMGATVIADINREVLARLGSKTFEGFLQEVRLIDGYDDGQARHYILLYVSMMIS